MSNKKGNYCSYCRKKINDPNLLVCPVCGNPYNRQNESLDKDLSLLTALNSEYGVPEEVVSALRSAVNPDYIESLPNVKEQTDETCDISIDNSENNTEANKSVNLEKITSKKTSAKTEKPKIQVNSVKENRLDSINSNEINESDKKVSRSKTAIIIASLLLFFVVTFGFVTGVIRFGSNNNISDKHDTTEVGNIKEINTNSDTLPTDYSSDIVDNSSKEIYFPSFVGENIEAAIDFLDDCDISYIIKEEYSDLLEKGKIISQTPNGDTDIDSGMEVRFEVSKGSHTESMPKSSVSKSDNTSKNSTSNKLNSSSKTSESSNTSTATVSQQTESSNDVIMPNIIGMNYNDAIIILTSNNLNCTYTSVFDDNTPQNTVMTQNPSAGTAIKAYSNVTFTYSIGSQPTQEVTSYEYEMPAQENNNDNNTPEPTTDWNTMPFKDFIVGTWVAYCENENFDQVRNYYSPGEIILKINSDFSYEMWIRNKQYSGTYSIYPLTDGNGNDQSRLYLRDSEVSWGDFRRNSDGDLVCDHSDTGYYNSIFNRQ